MQGVGRERFAACVAGDDVQDPPARGIDADRDGDGGEDEGRCAERCVRLEEQPPKGLEKGGDGEESQQRRFAQRRHGLDLAMAIMVVVVGRPVRLPHGEEGQRGHADVEQAMRRVGQKRQRTGDEGGDELQRRDDHRRRDGPARRAALEPCKSGSGGRRFKAGVHARPSYNGSRSAICPGARCEARRSRRRSAKWNICIPWCGWVISTPRWISGATSSASSRCAALENEKGRYTLVFLAAPNDVGTRQADEIAAARADL